MKARILLVGGLGYFGRLLTAELLRDTDADIVIGGRAARAFAELRTSLNKEGDRLRFVPVDLAEPDAVAAASASSWRNVRADWRRLERAAWLSMGAHLVAGLAMAFVLRWGLETNPDLESRLRFLADRTLLWRAAWGTWNAAALSVLWFFYAFARARPAGLTRTALRIGFAAVALDLCAEAIEMWHVPGLAADALGGQGVGAFFAAHRVAVLLTGFGANGLYTLSSVLLAYASRDEVPRWTRAAGWGVGAAGAALSCAALAGSAAGMFWTNVVLVPCIASWQLGVALAARRRAIAPCS